MHFHVSVGSGSIIVKGSKKNCTEEQKKEQYALKRTCDTIGDGMADWNREKKAAVQLMNYLKSNLSDLEVGAIQFSGPQSCDDYSDPVWGKCRPYLEPGYTGPDWVEIQVNISSNLSEVENQINKLALMDGNTEWGSPLATCHKEMLRAHNTKNTTKKFCVLISDGKPNIKDSRWTSEYTTPEMRWFCKVCARVR